MRRWAGLTDVTHRQGNNEEITLAAEVKLNRFKNIKQQIKNMQINRSNAFYMNMPQHKGNGNCQ